MDMRKLDAAVAKAGDLYGSACAKADAAADPLTKARARVHELWTLIDKGHGGNGDVAKMQNPGLHSEYEDAKKVLAELEEGAAKADATSYIVAIAEAYELKDDLGGGFRGVAKHKGTGEIMKGDVRRSLDEARNDAKNFIAKMLKGVPVSAAPISSKNNWRCNYWSAPK